MTSAGRVRRRIESAPPNTFFKLSDFPGASSAIETALSRLAAEGAVKRVRNGLYWKGVNSRFGTGRPSPLSIAGNLGGRGAGPAAWTASYVLGLTTQVPGTTHMTVVGRHAPKAPAGIRFHTRSNLGRLRLSAYEIAVLEVLRDWPVTVDGGWAQLTSRVAELDNADLISLKRIAASVAGEPPKVRELVSALTD